MTMTAEPTTPTSDGVVNHRLLIQSLREAMYQAESVEEARRITSQITALTRRYKTKAGLGTPNNPVEHARLVEGDRFTTPPHISYLSGRLAQAVKDVENGQNRFLTISMPPRAGKSTLTSFHFPAWILSQHPDWSIGMISHSPSLVTGWSRQVRRTAEDRPDLGITLAKDHGGSAKWETVEGGGVIARSIGGSVTGEGFKILLLDDIVKDFATAHSEKVRETTWDKWLADYFTRLEPPYLVAAIGTRWHEDDFIGRLLSPHHEGDSERWEKISFPAIAEVDDVLGRAPGQPLFTPLIEETTEEAIARWGEVRKTVGEYTWAALYQQDPSPAKGSIFDIEWFRYWTTNPGSVSLDAKGKPDGRVVLLDPEAQPGARWLDSWDMAFKGSDSSDYVVGQRWVASGTLRVLVAQVRARLTFTRTVETVKHWSDRGGLTPYARHVFERIVEDKANGTAVIDLLKDEVDGLIPVNPTDSKEGRARAITPDCESGNVLLPYPGDPGNEWVQDLLSELRNFPHSANDDQTDALTQALARLRGQGSGSITVPGRVSGGVTRNIGKTALSEGLHRRIPGRR